MPTLNVTDGVNVSVSISQAQAFEVTINKGPLTGGLPAGNVGTLQFNSNGVFGGVPTTNYANGILSLGSNSAISIGGGANAQALLTNGAGALYWADISTANTANYANFANIANTANVALTVVGQETIPFAYGDATPKTLTTVPANAVITEVSIVMLTPFSDATGTLSIGDSGNIQRLLATTDVAPSVAGTYTVDPAYKYASSTQLILTINPGTSTVGNGLILINYE